MAGIVDLRSDTVTRPSVAMRSAMATAPVGDDVFGDDPSVQALEARVATLVGKDKALYVPSGTMANQLAVRVHCRAGDEAIVHAGSHIMNFEGGAAAALSGVTLRPLASSDGTLPLVDIQTNLFGNEDPHRAQTRLICIENTHNSCGGVVVPQSHVRAVAELARSRGIALHLDGARLMNASVATGLTPAALAAPFDTVSLCLSKGLGAPIGSVLSGPAELIFEARRWRKRFGGGMRQAGVLAAAGLFALDHNVARLAEDHSRARILAEAIAQTDGLRVDLSKVQTNIVYFDLDPSHPLAKPEDGKTGLVQVLAKKGVLLTGNLHRMRAVLHLDIDDASLQRAIGALRGALI